jgi:hypothetical protein
MANLPQDIIVHNLFPGLSLSKVIEITESQPDLLPKTKDYLIKIGESIGMKNIKDPKQVLFNLEIKTDPDVIFRELVTYFKDSIYSFILVWIDDYTYKTIERTKIVSDLNHILDQMYPTYMKDVKKNVDVVFGKFLFHIEVYKNNKYASKDIFERMFPNLYYEFYTQIQIYLSKTRFSDSFNVDTFLSREKKIHPVIKGITSYNADRILFNLLFK